MEMREAHLSDWKKFALFSFGKSRIFYTVVLTTSLENLNGIMNFIWIKETNFPKVPYIVK